jgi:hypothetical protein
VLPALVRRGSLVIPKDPYMSTQWGHLSPDGAVAVVPDGNRSRVFDVSTCRELRTDLHGRKLILGGWTNEETAYGIAYDGSPFGPHTVRLVSCELTATRHRCRVLRTIRAPSHQLVLFPTGSIASDH